MTATKRPSVERWILVLLGSAGIFAALAYYLGRKYTEAYYAEFGIPETALSHSPADFAIESELFLVTALVGAGGFAAQWFAPSQSVIEAGDSWLSVRLRRVVEVLRSFVGDHPLNEEWKWVLGPIRAAWLSTLAILFVHMRIDIWRVPFGWYIVAITVFFVVSILLRAASDGHYVWFTLFCFAFTSLVFVTRGPEALAMNEAEDVLEGREHLPTATLFFITDSSVASTRSAESLCGEVILISEGTYYILIRSHVGHDVVSVSISEVALVDYASNGTGC